MRLVCRTALGLAIAALIAAPVAHGAAPKLYRIALSGNVSADVTKSWAVPPPAEGCHGTVRDTRRITASFGVERVLVHARHERELDDGPQ